MSHPKFDFDRWNYLFPLEREIVEVRSRLKTKNRPTSPFPLGELSGTIISSPSNLCLLEQIRKNVKQRHSLGIGVPVDHFVWRLGTPDLPYLTKLGGVPHRESERPWPVDEDGIPFTFVGQICFADSRVLVPENLPGDVMLIFFRDWRSYFEADDDVIIEWSPIELKSPLKAESVPPTRFPVPQLSGEIHRCYEYPDADLVFEKEGLKECYLLGTTQSTKIGSETHYIQRCPPEKDEHLICTLSSIFPEKLWPFTNLEKLPERPDRNRVQIGWNDYSVEFGMAGCMYFFLNTDGSCWWDCDCY